MEQEKILFVDDEENILAAFRRHFRKRWQIETATSGQAGLEELAFSGPFAVVVADLRMPGMDGIQFLTRVKELSPDTVRIMLTGHADLQTAIDAVNDGNIFRFLTKPCPVELVASAVESGLNQHRLVTAERELLERTLNRSVKLLTEMLSLSNPLAFSRTLRLRKIVRQIVSELKLEDAWEYDIAAMLSQIGCVALPAKILEKVAEGAPLTGPEESMFASHPMIGYRLLNGIPRLEQVAGMVRDQLKYGQERSAPLTRDERQVWLGARILRVALDYDQWVQNGASHAQAVEALMERGADYDGMVVKALGQAEILMDDLTLLLAGAGTVRVGMILDEDVYSKDGELLGSRHQEVNTTLLEKLKLVSKAAGVVEPFRVLVPAYVLQHMQEEEKAQQRRDG